MPEAFNAGIDAVLWRKPNGKVPLFKGHRYVRFGHGAGQVHDAYQGGVPIAKGWKGVPDEFKASMDAALQRWDNGSIYFFRGRRYVRFSDVEAGMDKNYPRDIAGVWMPFPR
jgi:hemopexin